jgi:hypothetical protein
VHNVLLHLRETAAHPREHVRAAALHRLSFLRRALLPLLHDSPPVLRGACCLFSPCELAYE